MRKRGVALAKSRLSVMIAPTESACHRTFAGVPGRATESSAILGLMSSPSVVVPSKNQKGAWFFALVFSVLAAIFIAGGLGTHPNDLPWLFPAVLLSVLCVALATARITCDSAGVGSRVLKTTRVPTTEIKAITVESRVSQSSGRRNVLLVIERTSGKPIRLVATAMRDKPENRAELEANAEAMRAALGLARTDESAPSTIQT